MEKNLWLAVVMTAFEDVKKGGEVAKDALIWATAPENRKDFAQVCGMAGVDPDGIRRELQKHGNSKIAA